MIRFLYVDDDIDLLDVTRLSMEGLGFEVDTFDSTSGAISALEVGDHQAIVSDYEMPGMSGIELLKKLRSEGSTIPFILFTGRGREEVAVEALNSGADFYLIKGGEAKAMFAELANMVRQAVARREAERMMTEQLEQTRSLNRMYRFLCEINHAVVHTADRDSLFENCCRIAVEKGGFKMAAVKMLDPSTNVMSPFVHFGDGGDYLEGPDHDLDLDHDSLVARAVNEDRMVVCNCIADEPASGPWRERALRNGLRSSVYIPIRMDGSVVGVFVLYAGECNYFDEEETALLRKIAEYISQAVTFIRGEQRRSAMEQELARKEKRFRDTLDGMLEGCQIIGRDWRYLYLNDVVVAATGRTREDLIGRRMMDVYPGIERTDLFRMLRSCMEGRQPLRLTNLFPFPDGRMRWSELSAEPTAEGILILSQDCTDRIDSERGALASASQRLFGREGAPMNEGRNLASVDPALQRRKGRGCDDTDGPLNI